MCTCTCTCIIHYTCITLLYNTIGIGSPTPPEGLIPSSLPLPPTPSSEFTPSTFISLLTSSASSLTDNNDSLAASLTSDIKTEPGTTMSPLNNTPHGGGKETGGKFHDLIPKTSVKHEPMDVTQKAPREIKQEPMDMNPSSQIHKQPGTEYIHVHVQVHVLYMGLYMYMYMYFT